MSAILLDRVKNYTRDRIFKRIHGSQLIYNSCWEDPRIDREIMQINSGSKIVMITSAGCNTLDYLLDGPAEIHSVDLNLRQNALLHLKLAAINNLSFDETFQLFGKGFHPQIESIYDRINGDLPELSRQFWQQKLHYFREDSFKRSFYFHGTSGNFAWMMYKYIQSRSSLRNGVERIFQATTLEQQAAIYDEVEPVLWNFLLRWLIGRHTTMAMLGVPRAQRDMIVREYPGGLSGFLRRALRHIFTGLPIADNYFWRVYLTGSYTEQCAPEYLRRENFSQLRSSINRIKSYNTSIAQFLRANPGSYTHFVLLDHQDWLALNDPAALVDEWQQLIRNSAPGAKILLRSASPGCDFIPAEVRVHLRLHPELTEPLHFHERVGTYGRFHLATVER